MNIYEKIRELHKAESSAFQQRYWSSYVISLSRVFQESDRSVPGKILTVMNCFFICLDFCPQSPLIRDSI